MDAQSKYQMIGRHMVEMPNLFEGPITPEVRAWLGRAVALVEIGGSMLDATTISVAAENLNTPIRASNAETIIAVLNRVHSRLELQLPVSSRGAFIPAGNTLDAQEAIARVLGEAQRDVLVVDPYADAVILWDFIVTAPQGVNARLLCDKEGLKPALKPAAERFTQQFGNTRPLEMRAAKRKTLHDRLIFIDGTKVYTLGQSFNQLATRAHTSLVKVDGEIADAKVAAYENIWGAATVL